MWKYDEGDEVIWRVQMSTTDRGGAVGTVFLNYNNVAYLPDYVPAKWLLDSYSTNVCAILLSFIPLRPDILMD